MCAVLETAQADPVWWDSYRPAPRPAEPGEPRQGETGRAYRQPAPKDHGSQDSPIFVKVIDDPESATEAEQLVNERKDGAAQERRIADETQRLADYTLWLVIMTCLLGIVAIGQAIMFILQWAIMRRESTRTEEKFRMLERAYIFAGPGEKLILTPAMNRGFVKINVRNYGKTLGIIQNICAYFIQTPPTDEIPTNDETKAIFYDKVVMPGGPLEDMPELIFTNQIRGPVIIVGYVDYFDAARNPHVSRFCAEMNNGKTLPVGPPAWNEWT